MFSDVVYHHYLLKKRTPLPMLRFMLIFVGIVVVTINCTFLIFKFIIEPPHGNYYLAVDLALNHASLIIYVYTTLTKRSDIKKCTDDIFQTFSFAHENWKYSKICIGIIVLSWIILRSFHFMHDQNDVVSATLFLVERIMIVIYETELCLFLLYVKTSISQITNETLFEIDKRKDFYSKKMYHPVYSNPMYNHPKSIGSISEKHMKVYKCMLLLNKVCGPSNTVFTFRERYTFVVQLFFWISRNQTFDLVAGSMNFCRACLIFYSFQILKNQETRLKSAVNELAANFNTAALEKEKVMFNSTKTNIHIYNLNYRQLSYLHKQVLYLNVKFDACGFYSMDFNTVIYILTSTAGYLLLLSQLNM